MFNDRNNWNEQPHLDGRLMLVFLIGSLLLGLASFMAYSATFGSQVEAAGGKGLLLAAEAEGPTAVLFSAALQSTDSDSFRLYVLMTLGFFIAATLAAVFAKVGRRGQEDESRL